MVYDYVAQDTEPTKLDLILLYDGSNKYHLSWRKRWGTLQRQDLGLTQTSQLVRHEYLPIHTKQFHTYCSLQSLLACCTQNAEAAVPAVEQDHSALPLEDTTNQPQSQDDHAKWWIGLRYLPKRHTASIARIQVQSRPVTFLR
jgi:hypothetical protein